jgi:hypothetical protein
MFKITDDNYDLYKQTFEVLWLYLTKDMDMKSIDPTGECSPVAGLNSWEKKSKSLAKRGLKETLRDTLTDVLDLPNDMKKELDEILIKKELPSLNILVSKIRETPAKVLKRGQIKNIDEYYVIKEFLSDTTSDISLEDRNSLEHIFSDFENNYIRK